MAVGKKKTPHHYAMVDIAPPFNNTERNQIRGMKRQTHTAKKSKPRWKCG